MDDVTCLSHEERELLLGLALAMVSADGRHSGEESDALRRLGLKMGPDTFVYSARLARERFPDDASALAAARSLQGQRAREVIYGVLKEIAEADGLVAVEEGLLGELAAAWEMETE